MQWGIQVKKIYTNICDSRIAIPPPPRSYLSIRFRMENDIFDTFYEEN